MKKEKVFYISKYHYESRLTDIFKYYFDSKEKAINFLKSKISELDFEKSICAQKRQLLMDNEFISNGASYTIKELIKEGI